LNLFDAWPTLDHERAMLAIDKALGDEGSKLAYAAVWSVQHLRYLVGLDSIAPLASTLCPAWSLQVIDYAHGHWAAVTAVTAIDRCAAALGRLLPEKKNGFAYSLADLNQEKSGKRPLEDFSLVNRWVQGAISDPEYRLVADFRHPMVHRSISATAELGGDSRSELRVMIGGKIESIRVDDLVQRADFLARKWVGRFLELALNPEYPHDGKIACSGSQGEDPHPPHG
jgi:hypothetical protein